MAGSERPTLDDARTLLRERFGHSDFRPGQDEAVRRILEGEDLVVVMPTGAGKSACYQLPGLLRPGLTLVLSPLIALMKDQVEALQQRRLPADFVNSTLPAPEQARRLEAVARGETSLLYVAPERLAAPAFLRAIARCDLRMLAVDEAHCISQWGHDFRPAYSKGIHAFLERLPKLGVERRPQVVGLTATATPRVRKDACAVLGLPPSSVLVTGFERPNLRLLSRRRDRAADRLDQVIQVVQGVRGAGIVYCGRRRDVEEVTLALRAEGVPAAGYHAGLADEERGRVQEDFISGAVPVIVATNAFGMGIDKPDIRFVVHHSLPGSIEAYYQEAGRAGRDGATSYCVLVHGASDRHLHRFFLDVSCPPPEVVLDTWDALRRQPVDVVELSVKELAHEAGVSDGPCGGALRVLEEGGLIERLDDRDNPAQVRLRRSAAEAAAAAPEGGRRQELLRWLAERFEPAAGEVVAVRPNLARADLGLSRPAFLRHLHELEEAGEAEVRPPFRGRGIVVGEKGLSRRGARRRLEPLFERMLARRARGEERLDRMEHYAHAHRCRHGFLLDYFGDSSLRSCRACDNCCGWQDERPPSPRGSRGRGGRAGSRRRAGSPPARRIPREQAVPAVLAGAEAVDGRFGMGVLKLVLRGSRSRKVRDAGLGEHPAHGLLARASRDELEEILLELVAEGLLDTTGGAYPLVRLTEEGRLELERQGVPEG